MPLFKPDRYFTRISAIDVVRDIAESGFTHVYLDIDNTIRSRETNEIPADVMRWLDDARSAGLRLCLLSNSFHDRSLILADELGIPIVAKAMKPLPPMFLKAFRLMGSDRRASLMIGDQVSTDILGAHLVGAGAYLVEPLSNKDLGHMAVLRKVEAALLGGMRPEGENSSHV